jgi:predicted small integral membrane protein
MTGSRSVSADRLPARLPTAESVVLLMLVAFAATVIGTRWFLAWTGFPKIGGGDLHIAHALWGGALLFVGALLPLIWFGRRVHLAAAVVTGVGMGLFIDEVGKFITTRNDYFYPAAAPIIYSTFLLSVLLFLWIRRGRTNDHGDGRRKLASLLRGVADAAGARVSFAPDGGTGPSVKSAAVAATPVTPLTATFDLGPRVTDRPDPTIARGIRPWLSRREPFWLGGRGLRVATVLALLVAGLGSFAALFFFSFLVAFVIPASDLPLLGLMLTHVVVDGISGALMLVGGVALVIGRVNAGVALASAGLLVALALGDVLSFYLRQFDSIGVALFHLALLYAVSTLRRSASTRPSPLNDLRAA